jgi:DNA primase
MSVKNLSFIQARDFLAQRSGVRIDDRVQSSGSEPVFEAAVKYWQRKTNAEQTLRDVEKKWGVRPETVGILRIGRAGDPGLFTHLRKCGFSRKTIGKSRLFRKVGHKWRPFFHEHLIFPMIRHGRVCDLVGRALPLDEEPKFKYLKLPNEDGVGPRFNLYNVDSVRSGKRLVIVEGYGDASALHQMGFPVVAVGGTNASAVAMNQLSKLSARASQTCIFFDFDESGQAAAHKLAQGLLHLDIHAQLVLRPNRLHSKIKDPADIVRRALENRQEVKKLLTDAKPFVDVVIDSLPSKVPPAALEATLREPLRLVAQLDPVTSDAYVRALAKKFKLQRRVLLKTVKEIRKETPKGNDTSDSEDVQTYCEIEPGLGCIDSLSYFIVPTGKLVGRKLTLEPCMVTSNKDFIRIADDVDAELRGKRLMLRSMPLSHLGNPDGSKDVCVGF